MKHKFWHDDEAFRELVYDEIESVIDGGLFEAQYTEERWVPQGWAPDVVCAQIFIPDELMVTWRLTHEH